MLSTKIFEESTAYKFVVTNTIEGNSFEYEFGKQIPEGQELTEYLQNCKREAELLAQMEIDKKQTSQEIILPN